MQLSFSIRRWSAWSEHLQAPSQWMDWAAQAAPVWTTEGIGTGGSPLLSEVPAMQRRRLDSLSRMAIQVAWWAMPELDAATPLVFASRHGDAKRSLELLRTQARGESMSPTQFTLSVHNAIAANYSIIREFKGFYTAIAGKEMTAEAAFIEAYGLLHEGAGQVQIVIYDEPLPDPYAVWIDEPQAAFAWSMVVTRGDELRLDAVATPDAAKINIPGSLLPLALFLSGSTEAARSAWRWRAVPLSPEQRMEKSACGPHSGNE